MRYAGLLADTDSADQFGELADPRRMLVGLHDSWGCGFESRPVASGTGSSTDRAQICLTHPCRLGYFRIPWLGMQTELHGFKHPRSWVRIPPVLLEINRDRSSADRARKTFRHFCPNQGFRFAKPLLPNSLCEPRRLPSLKRSSSSPPCLKIIFAFSRNCRNRRPAMPQLVRRVTTN